MSDCNSHDQNELTQMKGWKYDKMFEKKPNKQTNNSVFVLFLNFYKNWFWCFLPWNPLWVSWDFYKISQSFLLWQQTFGKPAAKLSCHHLSYSFSWPLKAWTVRMEEKTSSATSPASAYACLSRADMLVITCGDREWVTGWMVVRALAKINNHLWSFV